MTPHLSRLDQTEPGLRVRVGRLEGQNLAVKRLQAMGLCLGREVEVLRQGNPLIVRFLNAHVGLSKHLAQQIFVERRTQ
ncbi:MAG TPA: FeoA family protein [Candidatus Paceibacterota bacterium]|nr:FeoA family protein [Verrucomicrobiota bacterium]HRY49414.1 FeoA family protein [Candidatus Paceibacterota bacterium]